MQKPSLLRCHNRSVVTLGEIAHKSRSPNRNSSASGLAWLKRHEKGRAQHVVGAIFSAPKDVLVQVARF